MTPAVIAASALIAVYGVYMQRKTAREKATLDLIEKVESTEHYRNSRVTFSGRRLANSLEELNEPKDEVENDDRQAVFDYLNHYELVSIGIRRKILDADIYKQWMKGPFVRDWNASREFIQRERWKWNKTEQKWEYYHRLFGNYQYVAKLFSAHEALVLNEQSGGPPATPVGPGDEALPDGDEKDT